MKRALFLLLLSSLLRPATAGEIGALCIRDGNIVVYAPNGSWRGMLSTGEKAIDAQSDGKTIAILQRNGTVTIYDKEGAWRGNLNGTNGVRLQVINGYIIIHHANGSATIYNASGSWCGTL